MVEHGLGAYPFDGEVDYVRQGVGGGVEGHAVDGGELFRGVVAQGADMGEVRVYIGFFDSLAEGGDEGSALGAGTELLLLFAAEDKGSDTGSVADIQGSDALGAVYLVSADGHQVDPELFRLQRYLAERLHSVDVEQRLG